MRFTPDAGCVGSDVVLVSEFKVLFGPFHSWFYSLVLSPQFPPLGIAVMAPLNTFHRHCSIMYPNGRLAILRGAIFIRALMSDSEQEEKEKRKRRI